MGFPIITPLFPILHRYLISSQLVQDFFHPQYVFNFSCSLHGCYFCWHNTIPCGCSLMLLTIRHLRNILSSMRSRNLQMICAQGHLNRFLGSLVVAMFPYLQICLLQVPDKPMGIKTGNWIPNIIWPMTRSEDYFMNGMGKTPWLFWSGSMMKFVHPFWRQDL